MSPSNERSGDARAAVELFATMQRGWNAADGFLYATSFAQDADFVNVNGFHATGRMGIAHGHDGIFRSIYTGSTVVYELDTWRALSADVAIAHVKQHLHVPQGPLTGEHDAYITAVLVRVAGDWRIAALQNTFVRDQNHAQDLEDRFTGVSSNADPRRS